ncbi:MAG: hypothetical protein V8Q85_03670 [Christensenellales bacterium]
MVVLLLLNIFVFPLISENQVEEVGYNDFLAMVDVARLRRLPATTTQKP